MADTTARSALDRLLAEAQRLLRDPAAGRAAGGAALGLATMLLGGRRRGFGRNALLVAGAGALGKVALDVFARRGVTQEATQGPEAPFDALDDEAEAERRATTLLMAMVAAAKADGHLDEEEESAIEAEMEDLPEAVRAQLGPLLRETPDAAAVAARAQGAQEGREVYAASALLCGRDHPAEVAYLDRLAEALGLSADEARDIEDGLMAL